MIPGHSCLFADLTESGIVLDREPGRLCYHVICVPIVLPVPPTAGFGILRAVDRGHERGHTPFCIHLRTSSTLHCRFYKNPVAFATVFLFPGSFRRKLSRLWGRSAISAPLPAARASVGAAALRQAPLGLSAARSLHCLGCVLRLCQISIGCFVSVVWWGAQEHDRALVAGPVSICGSEPGTIADSVAPFAGKRPPAALSIRAAPEGPLSSNMTCIAHQL